MLKEEATKAAQENNKEVGVASSHMGRRRIDWCTCKLIPSVNVFNEVVTGWSYI